MAGENRGAAREVELVTANRKARRAVGWLDLFGIVWGPPM